MKNFLVSYRKESQNSSITELCVISTDLNKEFKLLKLNPSDFKKIKCENAKFNRTMLEGTNGNILRYPCFFKGGEENRTAITILCRTNHNGEKGFCVSNFKGDILFENEKNIVKIARENGITNGKVVNNSYISSIKGDYELVEKIDYIEDDIKPTKLLQKEKWNLSDESKKIEDHINAINSGNKALIGKLSKKQELDFILSLAPSNTKQLVNSNNFIDLISEWTSALLSFPKILEYSEGGIEFAKQFLHKVYEESMNIPNYLEQVFNKVNNKNNIKTKFYITDKLIKENHNSSILVRA